ncbi:MAG: hypothetical protein ACTHXA_15010 [Gulosibacter sp.]|uniref:hypothetical protein n=1 Tax=Gulosibacter sp. TaxID=2817531 RepID=UPI003F913BD2
MKKFIIPAAITLLALTGCTSAEPEPTREEICAAVPSSDTFMSDYFDDNGKASSEALPGLYDAQEQAAAIGDEQLNDALRNVIEILEVAPSGQDGYVEVGVELQMLEQECKFS